MPKVSSNVRRIRAWGSEIIIAVPNSGDIGTASGPPGIVDMQRQRPNALGPVQDEFLEIIPPMEMPTRWKVSKPAASARAIGVAAMSLIVHGTAHIVSPQPRLS